LRGDALREVDFFLLVLFLAEVDFLRVAFFRTAIVSIVLSPNACASGATDGAVRASAG
jgi:hypothetical protein